MIALGMAFLPILGMEVTQPIAEEEKVTFRDDFSDYPQGSDGSPHWLTNSINWEVDEGTYTFDGRSPGFAVLGGDLNYRWVSVEATLTVTQSHGDGWKVAGVSIYADHSNYWHLALVESPTAAGARHYVELSEMLEGEWLAQGRLRQTVREGPDQDAWQYGKPYRLAIRMTPQGIEGTISATDGSVLHRIGYEFSDKAVMAGRAALRTSMFSGNFDDVEVSMRVPVAPSSPKPLPAFDVAAGPNDIGEATGFYYVKQIDGVWWVVDPRGRQFFAIGTDHCRMSGHWCEKLGYAPYGRNMEAKFGSREAWAASATDRLKTWNFNLLGAGGGEEAFYRGLAHTQFIAFGSTFSSVSDLCPKTTWTGFPNVFHPKWEQYCDKLAREVCSKYQDDPWLFGYFLDNELEWYGKTGQPWGLFVETMKKPADHSGKHSLVAFLRSCHMTIEQFNRMWKTDLDSFDDLLALDALDVSAPATQNEALEFVRLVADRYFAATTAAIRKHDPNHMVIGCRFAGDAPAGIWDIAGKYCDIVTFNYYGRVDLETGEAPGLAERFADYYRQAKRPLMITEWSFPALDSGLPCKHGAGQRFDTQTQRAQAYEIFQRMVFSLPFMVGSNYFMWVDEPALGISSTFPEDTNYGLVNERDEPYVELTSTAARVNALAYELHEAGIADVGVGDIVVERNGFRVPLVNRGCSPVDLEVLIATDGAESRRMISLPANGRQVVRNNVHWGPGGHLVVVQVDPARRLSQTSRSDDQAAKCFYTPGARPPASAPRALGRFAVVVGNSGDAPISDMPVSLRVGDLGDLPWQRIRASQVVVLWGADGRIVPSQIDPEEQLLSADAELTFLVPNLPARASETFLVLILAAREQTPVGPLPIEVEAEEGAFRLRAPQLLLSRGRGSGNVLDEIVADGVMLGSYNPLVWQFPGQNQWVRTNMGGPVQVTVGPVRARVRVTAEYRPDGAKPLTIVGEAGKQETAKGVPVPFRVTHEIIVYLGRPWFHARLLSIENTGDGPLQVNGYFFYLTSAIGGSQAGDTPATPDVPNYYGGGEGAWRDQEVGWVLGAEPWPGSDLSVRFWVDEGGIQHPDARKQFETPLVLQPGEIYHEPTAPLLTVYGAKAEGTPWRTVERTLKTWANTIVITSKA